MRERILESASTSFALRGYAGTTMNGVARAVGVAPRAVHHHFETKRDLFRACYDRAFGRLLALVSELRTPAGEDRSAGEWLGEIAATIASAAQEDRQLAAFISTAPLELRRNDELAGIVGETPDAVEALVAGLAGRLVEGGEVAAGVDAGDLAHLLTAVTLGVVQYLSVVEPGKADLRRPFRLLLTGRLLGAGSGEPPAGEH